MVDITGVRGCSHLAVWKDLPRAMRKANGKMTSHLIYVTRAVYLRDVQACGMAEAQFKAMVPSAFRYAFSVYEEAKRGPSITVLTWLQCLLDQRLGKCPPSRTWHYAFLLHICNCVREKTQYDPSLPVRGLLSFSRTGQKDPVASVK